MLKTDIFEYKKQYYFAWGETTPKSTYTYENCKTWRKGIGDISGNPIYDAATANWGGSWRMPTKAEMLELSANCIWQWIDVNGVEGYKVTSEINGNSIFLPAAGYRYESSLNNDGSDGCYWSSTPYESDAQGAYSLDFYGGNLNLYPNYRDSGRSIRPVTDK